MAEERNRDNCWTQMGGLEFCSSVEGKEELFAYPSLYTEPNDFLQRSTTRNSLWLELEHRSRVKDRDRSHYGLGVPRRMKIIQTLFVISPV